MIQVKPNYIFSNTFLKVLFYLLYYIISEYDSWIQSPQFSNLIWMLEYYNMMKILFMCIFMLDISFKTTDIYDKYSYSYFSHTPM